MRLALLGPGGVGEMPVRAAFEVGPADTVAALVPIYVLASLSLLEPVDLHGEHEGQIRSMLVGVMIPLLVVFAGTLLFAVLERDLFLVVAPVTP